MTSRSLLVVAMLWFAACGESETSADVPVDAGSADAAQILDVPAEADTAPETDATPTVDATSESDIGPEADTDKDSEENPFKDKIGFEIIEVQSPSSIRAWISPEITYDAFMALELPNGWIKNQPRESPECGADDVQFIKSPDSEEDGDILTAEHFGFNWFHAATITNPNVTVDAEGLLTGIQVKKFHRITYNAGSCLVLLNSPEGEVYFRVGRSAIRESDTPTLPDGWTISEIAAPELLVIDLFDETLVIRTDNDDSFQGPVPQLQEGL